MVWELHGLPGLGSQWFGNCMDCLDWGHNGLGIAWIAWIGVTIVPYVQKS